LERPFRIPAVIYTIVMNRVTMLLLVFLIKTAAICAQGIQFEENKTFADILTKAQKEHKYIFVDCFATWCAPCKVMDNEVYTNKLVGDIFNQNFISVKLQMDKTGNDSKFVKSWYATASDFEHDYNINAYPTFLFFSPEGNILHKKTGVSDTSEFKKLAAEAMDPRRQYYTLIKDFHPGSLDSAELKSLAFIFFNTDKRFGGRIAADYFRRIPVDLLNERIEHSKELKQLLVMYCQLDSSLTVTANNYVSHLPKSAFRSNYTIQLSLQSATIKSMVIDYIRLLSNKELIDQANLNFVAAVHGTYPHNDTLKRFFRSYINTLPLEQLFTKQNIGYLELFTETPSDRGFDIFYRYGKKVDSIAGAGTAKRYAESLITNTEFNPFLENAKTTGHVPDFDALKQNIAKKYGQGYADDIIIYQTAKWFEYLTYTKKEEKFWPDLIKARIVYIGRNRLDTVSANQNYINNIAFNEFFMHSNDKQQLKKALVWMENVMKGKVGHKSSLLDTKANLLYKLGSVADAIRTESEAVSLAPDDRELAGNLSKMKARKPTWPEIMPVN